MKAYEKGKEASNTSLQVNEFSASELQSLIINSIIQR